MIIPEHRSLHLHPSSSPSSCPSKGRWKGFHAIIGQTSDVAAAVGLSADRLGRDHVMHTLGSFSDEALF